MVGTLYKTRGTHEAMLQGLEIVGPKMRALVESTQALVGPPGPGALVLVHCWRGGMRSGSIAWLLELCGYEVVGLEGGYKAFRTWVLERFDHPFDLHILGGHTGSGKTLALYHMERLGAQIVDLEGLAHHKGSAFGALGMPEQPSTSQFENQLALELHGLDASRPIWLEDESRLIGCCAIPKTFWEQMKSAPVCVIEVPQADRVRMLVEAYGQMEPGALTGAFERITRRLGQEATAQAIAALHAGDLEAATCLALRYYDKAYDHGLSKTHDTLTLTIPSPALPETIAKTVLSHPSLPTPLPPSPDP